ncbi:MAG: ribose-phosphate pyrophosphokinase [Clostridia bacterium]|nr:ribose-phosphate pyrophosphokinase [Clostridia bacterium]
MNDLKVFSCPTAEAFGKEVCENLGISLGEIKYQKFKNDNTFLKVLETVRDCDVYVIQTTQPPVNERVMELLFTIDALKWSGARRVTAVLPYFMYSRSDKKDQSRVPINAKVIAKIIEASGADRVLTCDLHNLAIQPFFNFNCDVLTAQLMLEDYFKEKGFKNMVVVATDAGSTKKAHKYCKYLECPMAMIDKRRDGNDDNAKASTVVGKVKGKTCIIFDDEIDTAGSICEAARILEENGAKEIYAGCTHGVLSADAVKRLNDSPIKEVVMTNTVPIPKEKMVEKFTVLSMAPKFAEAIRCLHEGKPLGRLINKD